MKLSTPTERDHKRKKPARRRIGFVVMAVVIPATGETVGALVPAHPVDRRAMRERKYTSGTVLKAELRRDRNPYFYRKAHRLAGWLADNVEGFEGLAQHDSLKRLQEQSGIGCIAESFDIPGLGTCTRHVAESLNFEDMDEGRFNELWAGWLEWLRSEKWGGLTAASVEEVEALIRKREDAA